jgi:hypothetical protein
LMARMVQDHDTNAPFAWLSLGRFDTIWNSGEKNLGTWRPKEHEWSLLKDMAQRMSLL